MTTPSGTELREWLDRLAIQDLINRYSDAVTRADWQQCESLFAVDAVWESPAYDDFARINGRWKFSRREFVPVYVGMDRVTGDVFTPRSALLRSH